MLKKNDSVATQIVLKGEISYLTYGEIKIKINVLWGAR